MNIASVMTPCPYKIPAKSSLNDALAMMEERGIRHLPVFEGEEVIGIVWESLVRSALFVCESSKFCPDCGTIAEKDPFVVSVADDVGDVAKTMADRKLDCALVQDEEENFVGIFTSTDAFRALYLFLGDQ
ncbi:MAG: CBS domain-containing protein [Bdellovibrionales bacterium]|nr:CBS domain-containing protein [Bdellovibrionales bacterium]